MVVGGQRSVLGLAGKHPPSQWESLSKTTLNYDYRHVLD